MTNFEIIFHQYLSSEANQKGWSKIRIPQKTSGEHIAVIGAGPAGLACGAKLLEAGHAVTVFDKSKELGGMVDSAGVAAGDGSARRLANRFTSTS